MKAVSIPTAHEIRAMIDDYPEDVETMERLKQVDNPVRRERALARMVETERKVEVLLRGIEMADLSAFDQTILDCRMDGMSGVQIARHLNKHHTTISVRLSNIAERIHNAMKG